MRDLPEEERADILRRLTAFLSSRIENAEGMTIELIARAGQGDSQQNWSFDVVQGGSTPRRRPLLLRRNGQSAATESNRETEYRLLRILHEAGLPVPEPYWLDAEGVHFGRPGFIMERCGGRAHLEVLLDHNVNGFDVVTRLRLAQELTDLMARIHALDWRSLGIGEVLEEPKVSAAQARLTMIVEELERWQLEPMPEFAEAIDWLERNMPPSRPPVLTHGEFRSVQALVGDDGRLVAMLDWEFARLSDPLDELAYFHNPTASYFHTIPGVWEESDFLSYYEERTGARVDRAHLHWWKTLNMLWVMSFAMQSVVTVITGRSDSVRTSTFHAGLTRLLQNLLDEGQKIAA